MTERKKIILSLIFNVFIFIFEVIGLILSIRRRGVEVLLFYTEISNYFTLLISIIFIIFTIISIKTHKKYSFIYHLKFISCVCLTITILVVLFVLIPMLPNMVFFLLFEDSNLYQHLLCPILTIISFLFLENRIILPRKMIFYGLLPTIIYGLIMLILNITKVITGPYPFFYVYLTPLFYSLGAIFVIMCISLIVTLIIYFVFNKKLKQSKDRKIYLYN